MTTTCPYCEHEASPYHSASECPHCHRAIFAVPCPSCGKRTLNLTHLPRYGRVTCFACRTEVAHLPELAAVAPVLTLEPPPPPQAPAPAPSRAAASRPAPGLRPAINVTPRAPKTPVMPTAEDARGVLENCLVGLERAAQDREMLRTPDLRALVTRFVEDTHEVLAIDDAILAGEVTAEWLRDRRNLTRIVRACYYPMWPVEGALLPALAQAWMLAVDDAIRRWQYARRVWLAEEVGLVMMPTVPNLTTANATWHDILGNGPVVTETISPGFLLQGEVLRRARIQT